jgi:hypothetical protein
VQLISSAVERVMKMPHKRLFRVMLLVIAFLSFPLTMGGTASAAEPVATRIVIYDAAGNALTSAYAAEAGAGKHLTARVFDQDGRPMGAEVQWSADPGPGYVTQDGSGSGATVTMTKDLYDDPNGFEPWMNVRACTGTLCAWLCVNSVSNLTGQWRVYIEVTNAAFGSKWITIQFVQNGRNLVATGIAEKPMTATLNGRVLQFHDPNNELTYFRGALTRQGRAQGQWVSFKEYKGNWYAKRQ